MRICCDILTSLICYRPNAVNGTVSASPRALALAVWAGDLAVAVHALADALAHVITADQQNTAIVTAVAVVAIVIVVRIRIIPAGVV